jgi:ATP phosphoribosyltransferase
MTEPLRVAVPLGALFEDTLELLDSVGVDCSPLRAKSRSLLFPGAETTLVTMRPSDVPTYVEAGAVDLGITGKDVLMEQQERVVYELLDLRYGYCRMVVATASGDHYADELERRLGAIRIATKYPRVAARYFEGSGRQAEVIEVKGSVELAPVSGLADGIVDLTASGRTLKENALEIREVIAECTARLVANRVAHKLRQAQIDDLTRRIENRVASGAAPRGGAEGGATGAA